MRPTFTIPNVGTLREITIWKAIVLTIVTLGIYMLVLIYQHSKDLHATAKEPSNLWQIMYWLSFVTFGVTMVVLYVINGLAFKEMRARAGLNDDPMWIIALVLSLVLPLVGQILWAVHFNDTLRVASGGQASTPGEPPMAGTAA